MKERTVRMLLKTTYPVVVALLILQLFEYYYLEGDRLTPWLTGTFIAICVGVALLTFVPTPGAAQMYHFQTFQRRKHVLRTRRPRS